MTAITEQNRGSGKLLLLLLLAGAVAFAIAVGQLELSHHAAQGRQNTSMDAAAIQYKIDNGGCKKVETYVCPSHNQMKVLCQLKGDLWAGLIIGTTVEPPVIVTGYVAPINYWYGTVERDGCYLSMFH